ncbi:MAG TPA: ATP-dependent 6-phosphofructokinase [Solirubrobacterales bacterium]|nr:ATP-dependent 6-phosphofructokinase [Solirubrobacterales bacterium]
MRIGVLTAGGDCPGLNAVIRSIARSAFEHDDTVIGIRRAYQGLAERDYAELSMREVSGILHLGGTILGTSSFEPHREKAVDRIAAAMREDGIDAVIAIGGEHTMEITRRLYEEQGLPMIGVPKTIDNDVAGTDYTFGFDTAVQIVTDALDRLHTTAQSHDRVMVVEVMGRNTGWIAVHAGLAGGADGIVIPEVPVTVEELVEGIRRRHDRGKDFSIIVVAEGAKLAFASGEERLIQPVAATDEYGYPRLGGIGAALGEELESRTGYETRVTVLGHVQRGGSPTATDRILATRYGAQAYAMARAGEFGRMAAIKGAEVTSVPLAEAAHVKPVDTSLLDIARRFYG